MKEKIAVHTDNAPKALGPYSQAIRYGGLLFCSGQIALDPKSGNVVGATAAEQTKQVMTNIEAVLKSQGAGFGNILKSTVFLKDMGDFAAFNEVYQGYLKPPFPARSTVEVARLPKDVRVEIEVIVALE